MEDMLEEGTLGCGLEVEPLGHVGFVLKGWEGEMVGGVVLGEEIVCYGAGLGGFVSGWVLMDSGLSTYFGQLETGVGVLDYGRHAVAVDGEEGGLF